MFFRGACTSQRPRSYFRLGVIVQIITVTCISLFIFLSAILGYYVTLNAENHFNLQTSSKLDLPPPSKRITSKIVELEKELKKLQNEVLSVAEDLRGAMEDGSNVDSDLGTNKRKGKKNRAPKRTQKKISTSIQAALPTFNEREPKKWWIRQELFPTFLYTSVKRHLPAEVVEYEDIGSIIPIDLSVNHLQRIERAPGSPNINSESVLEEFLPVVLSSDVDFRWRSRARSNSRPDDIVQTTAYRIIARRAQTLNIEENSMDDDTDDIVLWDSGKVDTQNGLPDVVRCNDPNVLDVGSIIEWKVIVWDFANKPATSDWSKFAVGPNSDEWQGEWISHPTDMASWDKGDASAFWVKRNFEAQNTSCDNWMKRKQLPIFRAMLPPIIRENDEVATVLLIVSGLGSFRTSMDGQMLSSSGPLDPPLTDFAQRVSYRGYDITPFFSGNRYDSNSNKSHVIGIAMGSGWWDHRPIAGSFIRLFYFPRGAVTCIAEVHITYKSGKKEVILSTGDNHSGWQVAKGHLRESSLFSGEYIDLRSMASFDGWDTVQKWSSISVTPENQHMWTKPVLYDSDTTLDLWRYQLHIRSKALQKDIDYDKVLPDNKVAPIGKLVPHETPPVLPMEIVYPDEVYSLGAGRWMVDFGKALSGMIRFENGLPDPIVPEEYPRGHTVSTLGDDESFITVLYGDSIESTTGDINLLVVAGMGLRKSPEEKGGRCYPEDHIEAGSLMQRDVYILPRYEDESNEPFTGGGRFSEARQSHFTTHAFRFAEICCTAEAPVDFYALSYRTAFNEWGKFSSSNVLINGGYELVRNAFVSNMLGVQSDCPHREKIQYGGDINANAPAALHFFDLSAFYRKVVFDWRDQQWDNGAYAGTSHWLALNDYAGIGKGAGETVWATAPLLITVRHFQHYGDLKLLQQSFSNHMKWLMFLSDNFDEGMKLKDYDEELRGYRKSMSGLGDWLSFRSRDTWLMHQSFYMASARCIAYMAKRLGRKTKEMEQGLALSKSIESLIARLYLKNGNDCFLPPEEEADDMSPGPEMSLYSRVVPAEKRCAVLRNYFRREGHTWPGSEENNFLRHIPSSIKDEMINTKELALRGTEWSMAWSQWHGFNEGIFAIRYSLKTLSDNGFHNVALNKANGYGVGTFEYMLSHNATTHWESWWRSEDGYSRNHPMLGASAEWMVSAAAGVSLYPTTVCGKEVRFWPRFPNSAKTMEYASATQGTRRGDFSIEWKFSGLPKDRGMYDTAIVSIVIRVFVPPDGKAFFRVPEYSDGNGVEAVMKYATTLPNIEEMKSLSNKKCETRRKAKMGFHYNWEFLSETSQWTKVPRKKTIGTPCKSFLFYSTLNDIEWSTPKTIIGSSINGIEIPLGPGLYEVIIDRWQLKPEVNSNDGRIGSIPEYYQSEDVGPYCADSDTFEWDVDDASHLI